MKILLKSVKLVDKGHPKNGEQLDILINKGSIEKMAKNIKADDKVKVIDEKGLSVSKGWIDLLANFQDPGYEFKEDIQSGLAAASAGGFTKVCVSPLSNPVRDSKGQIEYLVESAGKSAVEILAYGSLSKAAEGKELSEFYDLMEAGAIGFSDDRLPVKNPNLLKNALLYSQSKDALVVNFPYQSDLSPKGVMNEGESSTGLGLKGIPQLAEEIMVQRDLSIQEYSGGRLHLSTLSSSASIEMVSQAKKKGAEVSCDLPSYLLLLSDEELDGFDSRFKCLPPLRSKAEVQRLKKAVKQGKVNALCSNHLPEDIDAKKKEFDLAAFGMINLQTAVPAAITALQKDMSIEDIVELFTKGPADVLGIELNEIKEGESAELTLFKENEEFIFKKELVQSKSENSPFFKRPLSGKVYGIINKDRFEKAPY